MSRLGLFIALIAITGCAHSAKVSNKPVLPSGRTPANTQTGLVDVEVVQQFCVENNFRIVVDTPESASTADSETCFTLAADVMQSQVPIKLDRRAVMPLGNFYDTILELALREKNLSFRDSPGALREYTVRSGSCLNNKFFAVESALQPNGASRAREKCRWEEATSVRSFLPLTGVYPRVAGESLDSFLKKLQGNKTYQN